MPNWVVLFIGFSLLVSCGREKDPKEDDKIVLGELRTLNGTEVGHFTTVCQAFQDKKINIAHNEAFEFDLVSTACGAPRGAPLTIRKSIKRNAGQVTWSSAFGGNFFSRFESHDSGVLTTVCRDIFNGVNRNNYDMFGDLQAVQYAVVKLNDTTYDVATYKLQRPNLQAKWELQEEYVFRLNATAIGGLRRGFITRYKRETLCGANQFDFLGETFKSKL